MAFPSSKSWAPLRHLAVLVWVVAGLLLFPASKAGLHCDFLTRIVEGRRPWAFPSTKSWAPLQHRSSDSRMRLPDGNNGVRVPGLFRERMIVVYTTDMLGDEVIDLVAGEIIDQKELAGRRRFC